MLSSERMTQCCNTTYHERVALRCEDLDLVNLEGYRVLSISLDDSERVVIDSEVIARVTCDVEQPETVPKT